MEGAATTGPSSSPCTRPDRSRTATSTSPSTAASSRSLHAIASRKTLASIPQPGALRALAVVPGERFVAPDQMVLNEGSARRDPHHEIQPRRPPHARSAGHYPFAETSRALDVDRDARLGHEVLDVPAGAGGPLRAGREQDRAPRWRPPASAEAGSLVSSPHPPRALRWAVYGPPRAIASSSPTSASSPRSSAITPPTATSASPRRCRVLRRPQWGRCPGLARPQRRSTWLITNALVID